MIQTFKQFNEAKDRTVKRPPKFLYHLVDWSSMKFILDNNLIKGNNYYAISTTKDAKLSEYIGSRSFLFWIVLDAKKLFNDYPMEYY